MNPPLNPLAWIVRFRRNRQYRPKPAWHLPVEVPDAAKEALIRSVRESMCMPSRSLRDFLRRCRS